MSTFPDEIAPLNAVFAAPDDDAPRLVYADWLEENGQPERAEFIRLQIAAARKPGLTRLLQILRREAELLAAHGETFAGALAGPGLHWHFRRGFIHRFGHDGVYRSLGASMPHHLRFLPDGTVLDVSSHGTLAQILPQLMPSFPRISRGRYFLNLTPTVVEVDFSSTSESDTVDYTGIIEGQSIQLSSQSRMNGRRTRRGYIRVDV